MTSMSAVGRIALLVISLVTTSVASAQADDYQEAARLFRAGQHAQALDRTDSFLKANPKDPRGRFLKGLILTEQGKPAEAIKIFTALTEDFPELPEPYNNLGVLYASQGQYDKARAALELSIRTHPSYATAHENLGDVYAKMASQAYDKALQIDKGNATAQTKLGLIKELFSRDARATKPPVRNDGATKAAPVAASKPQTPFVVAQTTKPVEAPKAPPAVVDAPKPATAPEAMRKPAESPQARVATDASDEVIKAVNGWAQAWSDNDVKNYLAYYAPGFQPPAGEPRSDWEAARKLRIAKPKKIDVQVQSPQVRFADENRVQVTFRQSYRSPGLKAVSTKTLVMVRAGDRWLIEQERIGGRCSFRCVPGA